LSCFAADVNFYLLFFLSCSDTNMTEDGFAAVTTAADLLTKTGEGVWRVAVFAVGTVLEEVLFSME
jgi:hypothetical protein